jgi:hypothetical protein
VAGDGSTLAFWAVHISTGGLLGVLPDGSGGGDNPCSAYDDVATPVSGLAGLKGAGSITVNLAQATQISFIDNGVECPSAPCPG